MSKFAGTWRALAAAGLMAAARCLEAAIPQPVPISPFDVWMLFHPNVSSVLVWEFPPKPDNPLGKTKRSGPSRTPFQVFAPIAMPTPEPYFWAYPESWQLLVERGRDPGDTSGNPVPLLTAPDSSQSALPGGSLDAVTRPVFGDSYTSVTMLPNPFPPGIYLWSLYGASVVSFRDWPDWAKAELKANVEHYYYRLRAIWPLYQEYAKSGFAVKPPGFDAAFSTVIDFDPKPLLDPPTNLQPQLPPYDKFPRTKLESSRAFSLYAKLVGAQIAMDLGQFVPWSVNDYSQAELSLLFDGRNLFRYTPAGANEWESNSTANGHMLNTTTIPAPPWITISFLAQNGIIRSDTRSTLVQLFEWEKANLAHTVGGTLIPPGDYGKVFFGYSGAAPLSRIINGTEMSQPVYFGTVPYQPAGIKHWVGGCGVISAFNRETLRLANMPAEVTVFAHYQNRFSLGKGQHVGTAHADDAMSLREWAEVPANEILVEDAVWQNWFPKESDPAVHSANIGRRHAEVALAYLPVGLLRQHCRDINWWNYTHEQSTVYQYNFSQLFTVLELEAAGLWDKIQEKLNSLGGCSTIGY